MRNLSKLCERVVLAIGHGCATVSQMGYLNWLLLAYAWSACLLSVDVTKRV